MTLPLSSSPVHLDLATINVVQEVVTRELRSQVCDWEQKAIDASNFGDYRSAQQYKEWAFAVEVALSKVSTACTALFLDTCQSFPLVEDTRVVQLPRVRRSAADRRLDALNMEVVSSQPEPEPA